MKKLERVSTTPDRIREAMDAAGIKQIELAASTGLSHSTISRYLSGKMEPKQKAISQLAKALDVTEMWLWGYNAPQERPLEQKKNDDRVKVIARLRKDPDFNELVTQLDKLPADDIASIKQLVSSLVKKQLKNQIK